MGRRPKVLTCTKDEVAAAMRQFQVSATGEVLYNLWARKREEICSRGKRDKKAEDWYRLEGFDDAVGVIESWSSSKQKSQATSPVGDD